MEAVSIETSSRYLPTELVPQKSLHFFPILYDLKGFEKSSQIKSPHDDSCNSSLAIATVVPKINENVHTTTNFIELEERSLKKNTKGEIHPLVQKKIEN